ncbi:DUF1266 domain-containing protein [Pedobacter xixiisoli]|uniref:DUF1266 domain-containing protein n=1 Tax=Pedobacter xixiisoli TaxID=1476464 RepID=A0A285ZQ20_9SPHI|nr:DUF1266 domain-containing protein [Pedobacter xixiisoli]SOD11761.1 Protein of unknown function [Pedobacter xixiisoli]
MSTNVYFIIGAVAVVFIIYMMVLRSMTKKRKQQQLDEFKSTHSGNPLTEEQKRLLTFGAILFYYRMEKILGFTPENGLDQYISGLQNQWEISNAEDAKETLNNLLALRRSTEFYLLLQQPSPELAKIQKNIAKELGIELSVVEQTKNAYGWDICRAVSLAKWCYWCGYLTEAEAWSYMERAAAIANEHGTDWTDYTVSFLLGRTIQGFDLDDVAVESKQVLHSQNPTFGKTEDIDVYKRYAFAKS